MRPATAHLDLTAMAHNLRCVRELAPRSRVIAIVKANGYGHGVARILPALNGADAFGVACVDEALTLRQAGAIKPILLLAGVFTGEELALCVQHNLEIVVRDEENLRLLEDARLTRPVKVWLKIDTGMHRLGVEPAATRQLLERLRACPAVAQELGVMSHLASADDTGSDFTARQLALFDAMTAGLSVRRSLANSAGIMAWSGTHHDWVRPGIMLYGCSPLLGRSALELGLQPVMTLTTRLMSIKTVAAGETLGYAGTYVCTKPTRVGIAAIGYGDGYPRHAPTGTPVLVNGRTIRTLGRVSMDMLCLDLEALPDAQVGDPVTLWGRGLPAESVAAAAETIAYEILCNVAERVHFDVQGERL